MHAWLQAADIHRISSTIWSDPEAVHNGDIIMVYLNLHICSAHEQLPAGNICPSNRCDLSTSSLSLCVTLHTLPSGSMSTVSSRLMQEQGADSGNAEAVSLPTCASCCRSSYDIKSKCSRCSRVYYCNRSCQLDQWKAHKRECRTRDNEAT